MLSLPQVGPLVRKIEVARFSRTLGSLLANGVPLLTAMGIVRDTVGNSVIARSVEQVTRALRAGSDLAGPLAESRAFPALAVHMVRVGEETGRLEEMLEEVAEVFDQEVRQSIKTLLALLEPALVLGLGALIGGIIVSILMAILNINQLAF